MPEYTSQRVQLKSLPVLCVQWDGSENDAMHIVADLTASLTLWGATVTSANARLNWGTRGERAEFEVGIGRHSDGKTWRTRVEPKAWLVIWLHGNEVNEVTTISGPAGETLFEPSRPVVRMEDWARDPDDRRLT